jgi:hypothetical protein
MRLIVNNELAQTVSVLSLLIKRALLAGLNYPKVSQEGFHGISRRHGMF